MPSTEENPLPPAEAPVPPVTAALGDEESPPGEAGPSPRLRVGFVTGVTLTKWRRTWDERFPRRRVEVLEVPQPGQTDALLAGVVDLCFVRDQRKPAELHQVPLYEEEPVVLVHRDHPAAAFEQLLLADLADEEQLDPEHPDAVDLVAGGAGVLLVPLSVARGYSRRDLVHRPITDAAHTQVSLAWPVTAPHPWVEDYLGVVRGRTLNSSRTVQQGRQATDRTTPGRGATPKPSGQKSSRQRSAGQPSAGQRPAGQRAGRTRGARRPGRGR